MSNQNPGAFLQISLSLASEISQMLMLLTSKKHEVKENTTTLRINILCGEIIAEKMKFGNQIHFKHVILTMLCSGHFDTEDFLVNVIA